MTTAPRVTSKVDFDLYLITDRTLIGASSLFEVTEQALLSGVRAVQLREKDLACGELLVIARSLRALTLRFGARLLINDRCDLVLATGADGVHLGGNSIPVEEARGLLGDSALIGVSTHGPEEARRAEAAGADFVTLGPVFATPSKERYGKPIGLNTLRETASMLLIPVFAIGGIKKENARETLKAGARGVALISAIMQSDDPALSARELVGTLKD